MVSTDEVCNVARTAALQAAEVLLAQFGSVAIDQKSSRNLVTEADLASEEMIAKVIWGHFPDDQVLGEEGYSSGDVQADRLWVVDPLDATNNYAHGIPHFCISIAYAEKGEVRAGLIYDPVRREMFTAQKGQGARLNDRPIAVSPRGHLHESIVATGFYYDRGVMMERTLAAVGELFRHNLRGIRRMGSAALDLAYVAAGRFDGFFEYQLSPWDYAAGMLLVQEAGGRCLGRGGEPLTLATGSVIAGAPATFESLFELVQWREPGNPEPERTAEGEPSR